MTTVVQVRKTLNSERSFMKLPKKSLGEQLLEDTDSDDEVADKTFKL